MALFEHRARIEPNSPRIRLLVVLALGIAIYSATQYRVVFGAALAEWVPYIGWALFSLAAGLRSLVSARRAKSRHGRIAWRLLAAGALGWCAGILYLAHGELTQPDFVTAPTPANTLFLSYGLFFIFGLHFLRSGRFHVSHGIVRLANLGAIACCVLLCALVILFEPLRRTDTTPEFIFFAITDPATFITATILALTYLWMEDLGRLRPVVVLLLFSIGIHTAINLLYFWRALETGTSGISLDVFWLVAFALQYWAAFEHDGLPEQDADQSTSRRRSHATLQAMLPAALMLGMLAVMIVFRENLTQSFIFAAAPLAGGFAVLLGIREWAIERQQSRLFDTLQESHARNAHVLSASPAVIFICEAKPGYRLTFMSENARSQYGLDAASYSISKHVHPNDVPLIKEELQRVDRYGVSTTEFRLRGSKGGYRWVDQKLVLARDADGAPQEIIGSVMDITEKKALQTKVQANQRLESLGQLSGSIAHDFNNLLTSIIGFAGLLLDSGELSPVQRKNLEEIKIAGERGANLTRQLLAFSRRHALSFEAVDVNLIISRMTEMLHRLIGDSVSMHVRLSPIPVHVRADVGQLEQVIMNLVLNARDALPSGGELFVESSEVVLDRDYADEHKTRSGLYAMISVRDTGVGMDEQIMNKAFEPFFTTKTAGKGTGLGLATVHGIVEQHGGHVRVRSRLGEGTEFDVFLPVTDEVPQIEVDSAPSPAPGGAETILVVDDEPAITRVIASTLKPAGYTVLTANSAEDAGKIARQLKFDLLLTDVVMPDCNGRELERQLREIQDEFRVVYMSGYTDDVLSGEQVSGEGSPLLQKPLSVSNLAQIIRGILDEAERKPGAATPSMPVNY